MSWSSDRPDPIIFRVYQRLGLTRSQNRAVGSRWSNMKMIYESDPTPSFVPIAFSNMKTHDAHWVLSSNKRSTTHHDDSKYRQALLNYSSKRCHNDFDRYIEISNNPDISSALGWWRDHYHQYPNMGRMVRDGLCLRQTVQLNVSLVYLGRWLSGNAIVWVLKLSPMRWSIRSFLQLSDVHCVRNLTMLMTLINCLFQRRKRLSRKNECLDQRCTISVRSDRFWTDLEADISWFQ